MGEKNRKTGIDILGDVPWGTHFCQFYHTREDLIDILVPYFKAGLENNEFCMWITSEPFSEKEAKKAMRMAVPNFDRYLKRGQIEIIPYEEWYLKEGKFNLQRVLNGWIEKLDQALAQGYDGLRVTGNTAWLEKRDWRNFAEYEEKINNVIGKYRMIAICSYSLDKCGASEVIDVVSNHQFALIRREGKWEFIESSERKRAQDQVLEHAIVLEAINDVFREALTCETEEELGKTCLAVAEKLTASEFGFLGELNPAGLMDDLAISNPGWDACKMAVSDAKKFIKNMPIRGIDRSTIREGKSRIVNKDEMATHPDRLGTPEGHPQITAFLGVPLKHEGKTIGMIGLGNKESGYDVADKEAVENLSVAIVEALRNKRAEQALKESEERYRDLVEKAGIAILIDDEKGNIKYANKKASELYGYSLKEMRKQSIQSLVHPDDIEIVTKFHKSRVQGKRAPSSYVFRGVKKDGSIRYLELDATQNKKGENITGTRLYIKDVTERKKAEEQIKASLREKEVLLQEVHHRVKNNMQLISSLFNLQSGRIKDKQAFEIFKSSQNRVKSMALIHERLYQSKDLTRVDFAEYSQSLTTHLFSSHGINTNVIKFYINIKDVFLDINTAIPCSLIINELVSNSLKYAFPDDKKGEIKIAMRPLNKNEVELVVSDDGVGIPKEVDFRNTETLGLHLVNILVEDQLHGAIKLDRERGTIFHIRFERKR